MLRLLPRRQLLMGTLALVLVSAACGSRVDGERAMQADLARLDGGATFATPTSDATGIGKPGPPAGADAREGSMQAEVAEEGETAAEEARAATRPNESDDSVSKPIGIVTGVSPDCVSPPGTVEVSVQTDPLADVTFAASFADGHHYSQWGIGRAGPDGSFVWTVTVGANVPEGVATVIVAASTPQGGGGSGSGEFRVAPTGGC